jgi:hypothetical protein
MPTPTLQAPTRGHYEPGATRAPAFSYHTHRGCIVVVDACRPDKPSVTNGAEQVIEILAQAGVPVDDWPVVYRDTEGRYDQLLTQGLEFSGFKCLRATSEDEACRNAQAVPFELDAIEMEEGGS